MTRPLKVLIVDDNPHDRRLVIRELRKAYADAEIMEAIDEAQFQERLNRENFDIIITDYHLQWSDGIRILRDVKRKSPNCPVIMFTGTGNEEIAVEAMKQGLDDYIIKNVKHLIRLRAAVQSAVEHATTQRRADQLASRLQALVSQLHVGVFSCTPEGRFLDMNDAMVKLLECEYAADAYEKDLGDVFGEHADARIFVQDVLASDEPRETEISLTCPDQSLRILRINARIADHEEDVPRIDGLLEDVTRRRQAEVEAQQAAVAEAQIAMLTDREREVLVEVVAGYANKVIARRLDISEKTVEKHRASLMKKLSVRSVPELVRLAMQADIT